MKELLLLPLLLLLSGCLASAPKKIINLNELSSSSADKIKESMTLGNTEYQTGYSVKAFLYTDKYLELKEKENGLKNMDSSEKINQNILAMKNLLTNNKLCFSIYIETFNDLAFSKSNNWVLKLVDSESNIHQLSVLKEEAIPEYSITSSSISATTQWHNSFISCVDKRIKLEKEIKLNVIPQSKAPSGLSEKSELTWTFQ